MHRVTYSLFHSRERIRTERAVPDRYQILEPGRLNCDTAPRTGRDYNIFFVSITLQLCLNSTIDFLQGNPVYNCASTK